MDELVKMTKIIRHRGPDDEGYLLYSLNKKQIRLLGGNDTPENVYNSGYEFSPKENIDKAQQSEFSVAFGHRRLSILDLSPGGHQPLTTHDRRYWITYNGEIYNYIELRMELENLGHRFLTHSDTEVILEAYREWGIDCQNKFNGMWSFAIFDTVTDEIFLSRDRFGIKPLYYWVSPSGNFYFASEIKQFTVLNEWLAKLNHQRAMDYLYYSITDHTNESLFADVYQVQAGCCLRGNISSITSDISSKKNLIVWYNYNASDFKGSFTEATEQFAEIFKSAIELHLRADVPVGSALSGGLDSSSIVSYVNILLKHQGNEHLQKTFSSCNADEMYSEEKWVQYVIDHTSVDGHIVYPKGEDVFTKTEKILWHLDEPYQSQSVFLGYHVFQEARKNGVIVLLNGQGADEYLSGYGEFRRFRYSNMILGVRLMNLMSEVSTYPGSQKYSIISNALYGCLPENIKRGFGHFSRTKKIFDSIIDNSKFTSTHIHPYKTNNYNRKTLKEISRYQISKDPLQKYLRWEDRLSMAHSVEARVPFLDYRLVEFTRSLPIDFLDAQDESKKILVNAMKGILPEEVRNRKDKKGFITPEEQWFKFDHFENYLELLNNCIEYSQGIIRHQQANEYFRDMQSGKVKFDYAYWRLILFGLWMKKFDISLK